MLPKVLRLSHAPNRIFGLDLLRAFAIVTVLLSHGSVWVSPKFTFYYKYILRFDGVSIFFVLSGLLIGGILIRTLETKPATPGTLWDFWVKRWIRTVPPYFLALCLAMLFETSNGVPVRAYLPYFCFVQNLNWPHPMPYREGWSLAVEEWFYLLSAPSIVLLANLKLTPKYAVLVAAVTVVVLTTLHRYTHFSAIHPQTLSAWDEEFRKIVLMRLDALMYGVIAAWLAFYHQKAWLKHKTLKFVFGLAWLYLQREPAHLEDFTVFGCVFYFTCTAVATALTLPFLSDWKSARGTVAQAITHLSLISYSMYLLHNTILNNNVVRPFVMKLAMPQQLRALLGMALFWGLTLFFSTLMYKYFEVPVMALRNRLKAAEPKVLA